MQSVRQKLVCLLQLTILVSGSVRSNLEAVEAKPGPGAGDVARRREVERLRQQLPEACVSVTVVNGTAEPSEQAPVTFGQVFREGEFPQSVRVSTDRGPMPYQVDVKRRYPNGSVRFAVISALVPGLPPAGKVRLKLEPVEAPTARGENATAAELLGTGFNATLGFRFPDGTRRTVDVRGALREAGPSAAQWLEGPVATEWIIAAAPENPEGVADEDLHVRLQIRLYHDKPRVRLSVAVENCWDTWADNIRYDVDVVVDGAKTFERRAVDHRRLSRWRKVFWWGAGRPPLHVEHDLESLTSTGALPNYDDTLTVSARGTPHETPPVDGPEWDILGRGPLTAYMPTTGGRPEIAPYPLWTVRYLLTMDPEAKAFVLAAGDLAGSWPVHVRAKRTDRVLTIDDRPEFWLDARGKDRPHWKEPRHEPNPERTKLSPDLAHQPSLAYVPYLATGDYYYLEEAYFWANFCLLASWYHPRQNERGILAGQIRGDAWALRNIADAAWIATDGDPEVGYFDDKVRNNLTHRTKLMLGPPEYNSIGAWGLRTTQGARIPDPADPRWIITAPWEEDYLIWSLHHACELGWADAARPRDFLLRLRVGTLTHAPEFDPRLATPYRLVVGVWSADQRPLVYDDWETLGRENARLSRPHVPNYGCSYAYSARAALICGVDAGFPKAREALATLESMLADHRSVLSREPFWALATGGVVAERLTED